MSYLSAVDVAFIGIILIGLTSDNFTPNFQECTLSKHMGRLKEHVGRNFSLLSDLRFFFILTTIYSALDFTGMLVHCRSFLSGSKSYLDEIIGARRTNTSRGRKITTSDPHLSVGCGKFYLMLFGRTTDLTDITGHR